MARLCKPAILGPLAAIVVCLGLWPQATEAQVVDSLRSDTLAGFPSRFELEALRVVSARRFTVTGGVGAIEMRLDSLASVPVPTLEQALREMPLVRVRKNSRGEAQLSLRGATDRSRARRSSPS